MLSASLFIITFATITKHIPLTVLLSAVVCSGGFPTSRVTDATFYTSVFMFVSIIGQVAVILKPVFLHSHTKRGNKPYFLLSRRGIFLLSLWYFIINSLIFVFVGMPEKHDKINWDFICVSIQFYLGFGFLELISILFLVNRVCQHSSTHAHIHRFQMKFIVKG